MRKIIPILLWMLFIFPNITFWEQPNYPIYYWTKRCEIDTEKQTKTYALFQNEENPIYYIENENLYKNAEVYKKWVKYIFIELKILETSIFIKIRRKL